MGRMHYYVNVNNLETIGAPCFEEHCAQNIFQYDIQYEGEIIFLSIGQ